VLISSPTGPLGQFQPPWARDAHGKDLATSYTLTDSSGSGYVLTQHVNTGGATFPVTADPHYTWGWITGTIYFNKQETTMAAVLGGGAGFWTQIVPGWGTLLGAYTSTLATVAGIAVARHQCLKIKLPALVPETYSGGYCR
jgi:hypothetical protein